MDIISRLPQPIQHDILNFLKAEEIGRAAAVSKEWRSIVQTRPVLVFNQRLFKIKCRSDKETTVESEEDVCFMTHAHELIQRLVGQDLSVQKFSLWTHLQDTKSWSPYLDRWIQQLVEAKVKLLTLNLGQVHVLLPFVFLSETITNLSLVQCDLGQCNHMRLPNLVELSLGYLTLSPGMIDNIPSGCPNLEILRLHWCKGFSSICVSGLARLHEIELYVSQTDVRVVAPMLRVFTIHSCDSSWDSNSKIDLLACESTLRKLTLVSVHNRTAEGLTSFVSKFLGLEELVLTSLYVECIEIPNQKKLLRLEVRDCSLLKRSVRIDAPNLRLLNYWANNRPYDLVNPMIEFSVSFYLIYRVGSESYQDTFGDFFLKLRGFTNMKLIVLDYLKDQVFVCEFLDENVLKMIYDSKTLGSIAHVERITTRELLVDRLFADDDDRWNTISILSRDQQSNRKFLEVLSKEKQREKEEDPICCRYKFHKCWRHSLYDAEMIDEETTKTPTLLKIFVAMGYEIARIKLQWT